MDCKEERDERTRSVSEYEREITPELLSACGEALEVLDGNHEGGMQHRINLTIYALRKALKTASEEDILACCSKAVRDANAARAVRCVACGRSWRRS